MHKMTIATCLAAIVVLATAIATAPAGSGIVTTDRPEYFRHQLVRVRVKADSARASRADSAVATVTFRHGDSLVTGIGRMTEVRLAFDRADSCWVGTWAMPWNPPLGRYAAVATVIAGADTLLDSASFAVAARTPARVPEGFCAMTIESAGNLLNNKTPSPYGAAPGWRNFTDFAKFLGADAVWYSVGWTIEGAPGTSDRNPWVRDNFRVFPRLAAECHAKGLQFGGYVGSYLLWGPKLHKLKYDYSLEVGKGGGVYRNHHVSLDDPKRRDDIVKVLRQLQADSCVDFIGLDYIRPGAGGYETVDEFVRQMNIETPRDWRAWPKNTRIAWLARQVKPLSDRPIRARWQWWRAHRSATAVERLLAEAGVTKPVWGFTLGWDKGHEHGQDPPMMNDAGLDLDAVMLYESNAKQCFEMTGQWSTYLRGDEVQLLPGEQIDWVLLQKSVSPPAPEEFYWRLTDAIKGTTDGGRVKGLFWHDMFRSFKGRRGPHGMREWLIAGAASFAKVRQELGCFPVSARLCSADGQLSLWVGRTGACDRIVIEALTPQSPLRTREVELGPGGTDTVIALGRPPGRGLAAYRITWDGPAARDQIVLFKYFPDTYAERPFRALQSWRAGGDVAIIQAGGPAAAATLVGRVARTMGLVPNAVPLDSIGPGLRYKYPAAFVIAGDSLSSKQAALFDGWPARPVMLAPAANAGFDLVARISADSVRAHLVRRTATAPRRTLAPTNAPQ
ncbi:MAG: hypothetical protein MUF78_08460 [Candidatus Edwardsbacteria bacterium]|jgi:hypothetical protein|nr:hypothetical protein [Candidatus Edwardsbacteria bacterium]